VVVLYGRAGHQNGGSRPGQIVGEEEDSLVTESFGAAPPDPHHLVIRLDFSEPTSHKIFELSIQTLEMRFGCLQTHRMVLSSRAFGRYVREGRHAECSGGPGARWRPHPRAGLSGLRVLKSLLNLVYSALLRFYGDPYGDCYILKGSVRLI
jgi:hypothetical protein